MMSIAPSTTDAIDDGDSPPAKVSIPMPVSPVSPMDQDRALDDDGSGPCPKDPSPKSTDQQRLQRLSEGDFDAYWELWTVYQRSIFLICYKQMGGRHADAEDACSRVMQKARDILPRDAVTVRNLGAWLRRLTVNLCIDMNRLDRRRCQGASGIPFEVVVERPAASVASTRPRPDQALLQFELRQAIADAVSRLPPRLREAARLYYLSSISYAEISKALGISNDNVRKRIQESRALLRAELNEFNCDDADTRPG